MGREEGNRRQIEERAGGESRRRGSYTPSTRNATQRNATQRNAMQRNATQCKRNAVARAGITNTRRRRKKIHRYTHLLYDLLSLFYTTHLNTIFFSVPQFFILLRSAERIMDSVMLLITVGTKSDASAAIGFTCISLPTSLNLPHDQRYV